ncbi:hypothetical protein BaRGS_00031658 [Batillaria attramentaria]|uniref:Protein FAM136A n=1 Tax=Batillaria attramentaria TaxID=370345 RepID=A0ABD0JQC7_9CAEN
MDGAQARVQKAVNSMVSSLDKDSLRKLQADMYRCSTKCCEDKITSLEEVQQCIDSCSTRVNNAQNYIQSEIQMFQNRLQRCVLSCEDKIRDKISSTTNEGDMAKFRKEVEACAVKCADEHVNVIPQITKKMLNNLSSEKF